LWLLSRPATPLFPANPRLPELDPKSDPIGSSGVPPEFAETSCRWTARHRRCPLVKPSLHKGGTIFIVPIPSERIARHISETKILPPVQEVPVTRRCYRLHLAQNTVRPGSCSRVRQFRQKLTWRDNAQRTHRHPR
jgi:hypothetical protein